MKIVYWAPYIGSVGTIKAVINSALSMKKYGGHDVILIKNHSEWEGYEEQLSAADIKIIDFNLKKWFPNLAAKSYCSARLYMYCVAFHGFFKLYSFIKGFKPDVVITNLIALPAICAIKFARRQTYVISSIQGFPKFLNREISNYPIWMKVEDCLRRFLWQLIYKKADVLVCMTHRTRSLLISETSLEGNRVFVVPNPVIDENVFNLAQENLEDKWFIEGTHKRIVAIGRLTDQKDYFTLLKSIQIIAKVINVRLIILGDGYLKKSLEEFREQLSLEHIVTFAGHVENPFWYLKHSDLFILTSLWEDPGHVIIEAAAVGAPIVSTECQGVASEILDYGKYGMLCPSKDYKCIAEKALGILTGDSVPPVGEAKIMADQYTSYSHYRQYMEIMERRYSEC